MLGEGVAPTFTMTLPTSTTYYGLSVDIRAVNTTNDVNNGWFRYNNGTWSSNITMTYDSGNGWWEYETAANYWTDGDSYQIQAFLNATAGGGEAMDSATMITDTTPTFTISHPESRAYSDISVAVEFTVAGAASSPWNIYDGSAFVYASNQTGTIGRGLSWDTSYTLYTYAIDALGTEVVDSSRTFSVGPRQGGAVGLVTDKPDDSSETSVLPIGDLFGWIGDNLFLVGFVIAAIYFYRASKKRK